MASGGDITLQEVAARLGVHYMTAYRYVRTGRLPARREGVLWIVNATDVDKMRAPGRARAGHGRRQGEGPAKLASRMVAGDEAGAWGIVESALVSGVEPSELYLDVLMPALRAIGDGWAAGELTVADEHRASAIAQRLVGRVGPRFARRGRKRGTVVVGASPGDLHGLPCAVVADLLRGAGFEVLDLGANTPAVSFVESSRSASRLVAVVIGATTLEKDSSVKAAVRALRRGGITAPILVGGAAIKSEDHARRVGADGWSGPDGRSAVIAVERAVLGEPHGSA